MKSQAYYTDLNGDDNKCVTDRGLYVNSTGSDAYDTDFVVRYKEGRNDYHLLYLFRGELSLKLNKKRSIFRQGQVIIITPGTPFSYKNTDSTTVEYLWINFTGCDVEKLFSALHFELNSPKDVSIPQYIFEGFETFFTEFSSRPFGYEIAIIYKLIHIIILFSRSRMRAVRSKKTGPLSNAIFYISTNFNKPITTEELAEIEHVSCVHFRRLFKEKTGMTPTQYITLVRLKNAEKLLKQTNLTIKEIAEKVGFSDQLYFSKVFSNHFGSSPKAYRSK